MRDGSIWKLPSELMHEVGHEYPEEDRGELRALWQSSQNFHSFMGRYTGVKNPDIHRPETGSQVLPHSTNDFVFEKQTQELMPEDRRKGGGVIDESHIRGPLQGHVIMLNKGEERIDGIMRIPPRSDA